MRHTCGRQNLLLPVLPNHLLASRWDLQANVQPRNRLQVCEVSGLE
jgi:hypothetical protein